MNTSTEYGLTVLYQPPSPDDITYDLIAVHGLNGDAIETWTHKQSGVMWLRDLLPQELPNIRIMTYGYNARFNNFTGHQDLRNISMKLLSELVDLRKTEKECKRPIVYICHSLGGIVVKKALLIRCPREQQHVQDAAYGVIFLATPHSGSGVADTGKVIANIIHACSPFRPARGLLSLLRKDSKVLFEITEDFVEKAGKLQIVSFFELEMTSIGIFKRLVVEQRSAILNIPNEIPIGQFADHRNIARFSSVKDRNYRPVVTRLLKFKQDITRALTSPASCSREEQFSKLDMDTELVFDVPFDRCTSFRGRQQLLDNMDKYFSQSSSDRQLIYALTGLGGTGKTHSALQYALRNRFRYKDGVVFFNATSNTTLMADFQRICDLLHLGNTPDKIEFLRKWFASPRNTHWLMIFDGADNLDSVSLSKYFPVCSWGHIIITSRDPVVVGVLAPAGQAVEPLDEHAAIGLLLEKAAISDMTQDNLDQANAIVRKLGYLPLAIDQAGAFIRRRQKSLRDYQRLFQEKQYEILKINPGISGYDNTVATVWELNFRQLERDAPRASGLLILFSYLEGGNITDTMLRRACSTKKVWGRDGEIAHITPEETGLDQELTTLLGDEMQLDEELGHLLGFSLIQRNTTGTEGKAISVHPLVQDCATHRVAHKERVKWQIQAISLVAHAFPFSVYVDDDFGAVGREMFVHIPRILKIFDQLDPSVCEKYPALKKAVTIMLLSAARFRYFPWKNECIDRIRGLLSNEKDCYLKGWATCVESKILRLQGKFKQSYTVLENHIHNIALPGLDEALVSDVRWNATKGDIVVSFAETLIREGDLQRAQEELNVWQPIHPEAPSSMELLVLQSRDVMIGRILRNQGRFQEALPYLEQILSRFSAEDYYVSTGWQMNLISNITALYCEVGRPKEAETLIEKPLEISLKNGWYNISTGRQLRLGLIESFIRRGLLVRAEQCLTELLSVVERITDPDVSQSTQHFRVWVGLARISHLQGQLETALARWQRASELLRNSGWDQGFNHGVVLYSIAQILSRIGRYDECQQVIKQAQKNIADEKGRYWIVGLGSYWYDYIVTVLGSEGRNPVILSS
ncbi:LipA and NB-ARC domain protein [Aspergillus saccharolyticus JOP 1030-1]|uniref:DUF676 domain-containing protein n=1 Tax=Aspergillus saccharolyticus JOP 1030-1 TaxID=1450539 RepID=A0A318ZFQ5_9EURO|nr:hypothetical protein BP01DRAFT_414894 [Aspergillus saccharolyticus JOP 1030-1]PYH46386.1 hypothetical protein BP01DRAFT_414894 [Aspergillus saccharolyticus JOP 1030-1]